MICTSVICNSKYYQRAQSQSCVHTETKFLQLFLFRFDLVFFIWLNMRTYLHQHIEHGSLSVEDLTRYGPMRRRIFGNFSANL